MFRKSIAAILGVSVHVSFLIAVGYMILQLHEGMRWGHTEMSGHPFSPVSGAPFFFADRSRACRTELPVWKKARQPTLFLDLRSHYFTSGLDSVLLLGPTFRIFS